MLIKPHSFDARQVAFPAEASNDLGYLGIGRLDLANRFDRHGGDGTDPRAGAQEVLGCLGCLGQASPAAVPL